MSGMFWIALEPSNPKMGLITRLSLPVNKLTVFNLKRNLATLKWHLFLFGALRYFFYVRRRPLTGR